MRNDNNSSFLITQLLQLHNFLKVLFCRTDKEGLKFLLILLLAFKIEFPYNKYLH